ENNPDVPGPADDDADQGQERSGEAAQDRGRPEDDARRRDRSADDAPQLGFRGPTSAGGSEAASPSGPSGSGSADSGATDPFAALFGGEIPPELRQQLEAMGLG